VGNILDKIFDDEAFEKILKWADSSMNYPEKADKIEKLMKRYGLKPLDSGTNRICYTHKDYPKVVFKVGFDPQGILDNLNEFHKSSLSELFATSYELDEEGLILVQEKCPTIDFNLFQKKEIKKKIRKMLEKLDEEGFILIDLGLDKHKNYGVDRKGNIRIIDFGYVELKSLGNFSCPHIRYMHNNEKKYCKGVLEYNKDFTMLECDRCGNVFRVDVVLEGYTHTKYKYDKNKIPKYKPSKELDEFYRNFNKHRDRDTLKQFVSLSNKINMKGEGYLTSSNDFLEKLKRLSGSRGVSSDQGVPVEQPQAAQAPVTEETPQQTTRRPLRAYHSTSRGIDVLKTNDQYERETKLASVEEFLKTDKSEEVTKLILDIFTEKVKSNTSEEFDTLIRDLFFERFPHISDALKNIKEQVDESSEYNEVIELCKENNIQIFRSGINNNELHIAMQVEDLKHEPWIVMSHGETIVHINLEAHMKNISQVDHDEETDLIVTSMNTVPLKEFDGNYENAYFGNDEEYDDED